MIKNLKDANSQLMRLVQWKQDHLEQEVMVDTVEAMVVTAVETVVDAENTNI
jgi:hypothetical protein